MRHLEPLPESPVSGGGFNAQLTSDRRNLSTAIPTSLQTELKSKVELCGMRGGIPEPFACCPSCTTDIVCDYLGLCANAERIDTEGLVR